MDVYEDQLKCAGFVSTAGVLFPDMKDEMSFDDFFSLIGVEDYEYLGDDNAGAGCCDSCIMIWKSWSIQTK